MRHSPKAKKKWLQFAEETLGFRLDDRSARSHDAYSAVLVVNSIAAFERFEQLGGNGGFFAGHSVGQFASLAMAKILSPEDVIRLVIKRARLMQSHLVPATGMLGILGVHRTQVESALSQVIPPGRVYIAVINSTFNLTLSGYRQDLERLRNELSKEPGFKSAAILDTEGAWHSPFQGDALRELSPILDEIPFAAPSGTYVCNVSGEPCTDPSLIRENLKKHMTHPVQWQKSMVTLRALGAKTYIECGPGDHLSKILFFNRIGPVYKMNSLPEVETCAAL